VRILDGTDAEGDLRALHDQAVQLVVNRIDLGAQRVEGRFGLGHENPGSWRAASDSSRATQKQRKH
jgi:hypothetical protein